MSDEEFFAELLRRFRDHVDPDTEYRDDAFVLHRYDVSLGDLPAGAVLDPPLRFHITPHQLGTICRGMADDAVSAFGGPSAQAALSMLLTHFDETVEVGFDLDPTRRHVLAEPYLAFVADPAVPDQPHPSPQLPPPALGTGPFHAVAPLTGVTHPARVDVDGPGQGEADGARRR